MSDPSAPDPLSALMQGDPPTDALGMRAMLDGMASLLNAGAPEVGALHENVSVREVDGARVTADVVVPRGDGPHPVLVYLHGGGWVAGSPRTHRKLAQRFAEGGYLVFNVDYRLGPEHRFPAAYEDCIDAIRWAVRVAPEYGGDPQRLAVGGDSAGGNLTAASVAALADRADAPTVKAALLIYAALDFAKMGASPATVPGISPEQIADLMEVMVGGYLGTDDREAKVADPRVSPIHSAAKLPPTHVVCGTADALIDDAREVARRLAAAGVPHELREVEGMPHGFVQMEMFPQARASIDAMLAFLAKHV